MSTKARKDATKAETRITGRRFCTSHQGSAPVDGGMMLESNHRAVRWVCKDCAGKYHSKVREVLPHEFIDTTDIAPVFKGKNVAQPRVIQVLDRPAYKPQQLLIRNGGEEYKTWNSKGGD